jgi:hypothetical protein
MEYFIHLPEFQVIICKQCQYAVLLSYIDATNYCWQQPQDSYSQPKESSKLQSISLLGLSSILDRVRL